MYNITISTHNGTAVSRPHNIREIEFIAKENEAWAKKHNGDIRIDLSAEHEIWHDEILSEAYHKLFDEAVKEWNARTKEDRKIHNYLQQIKSKESKSKNAKHPVYEMIYSVGNIEFPIDESVAKAILRKTYETFSERNPNLYVVGAYYHADEKGVPHVHLDYIPIAECKRGMKIQNSLTSALKQQGIISKNHSLTSQILWERKENDYLESLCNQYGYSVVHPEREKSPEARLNHLSVEEFKTQKELDELRENLEKTKKAPFGKIIISSARLNELVEAEKLYIAYKNEVDQVKKDKKTTQEAMTAYSRAREQLEKDQRDFNVKISDEVTRRLSLIKDHAIQFIKENGLWQAFEKKIKSLGKILSI